MQAKPPETALMTQLILTPGRVSLGDWQKVYEGASLSLDPACHEKVAAGAAVVARIVAKGDPVYGINTGFGKLASVRIAADDVETLQRNLILSHCCGVGEPLAPEIVRLHRGLQKIIFSPIHPFYLSERDHPPPSPGTQKSNPASRPPNACAHLK